MKGKITIIGCGWIGKSLAEALIRKGYSVYGSTTSKDKMDALQSVGISPFLLNTDDNSQISSEIKDKTNYLIITIPPIDRTTISTYGKKMVEIAAQFSAQTKLLFLSSSSVYPKTNGVYSEAYDFKINEKNNVIFAAEEQLKNRFSSRISILRLGGLIGEDRHPVFHLLKRETNDNPKGEINLVHRVDVIRAIEYIIQSDAFGETYNVVHPDHPSRKEYYSKIAESLGCDKPTFNDAEKTNRIIVSDKIVKDLAFSFTDSLYNVPMTL